MNDGNIIKDNANNKHNIEKYEFATLYDNPGLDLEPNDIDVIESQNIIKKDKIESSKTHYIKSHSNSIKNNMDLSDLDNPSIKQNNNTPIHTDTSNNSGDISPDILIQLEKNISAKIDNSLSIIDELKNTIDNINTNSGDGQISDEEKQKNYQKGFDDGIKQTIDNFKQDYEKDREILKHTLESIANYTNSATKILENLENELSKASISIASEVIANEVENNSGKIALNLSKKLIEDIKNASKISLKVSPYDFDFISNNFEHPDVEIVSDNAIAKGGVIILSDSENIDGSISQRLGNIKNSLES